MIFPRSKIFIIYSSTYSKYKDVVINEIKKASESFAIKEAFISDDNISESGTTNLLGKLEEKIASSNGAIILYTPDMNFEKKKYPRPNMIFEMGMFFMLLPDEKMLLLKFSNSDYFSDIEGLTCDKQKFSSQNDNDETKEQVEIIDKINTFLKREFSTIDKNPLLNQTYRPNYSEYSEERYSQDSSNKGFLTQLNLLDNIEQQIVYIAERILFTSLIRSISVELVQQINRYLEEKSYDDKSKNSLLVLRNVIEYLKCRQKERTSSFESINILAYELIWEKWSSLLEWFNTDDNCNYINPLIPLLYFDYAGLTLHKIILGEISDRDYKDDTFDKIKLVEKFMTKALEFTNNVDGEGNHFWQGYVTFDLARLYFSKHDWYERYDPDNPEAETAKAACLRYFNRVIDIRNGWYTNPPKLSKSIITHLECEYFYAFYEYLKVLKKFKNRYYEMNKEKCLKEFSEWEEKNNNSLNDLINNVANKLHNF